MYNYKAILLIVKLCMFCSQLQDAFAKGLLKPGMNVLTTKSKTCVNNVVSQGAHCRGFVTLDNCIKMVNSYNVGLSYEPH